MSVQTTRVKTKARAWTRLVDSVVRVHKDSKAISVMKVPYRYYMYKTNDSDIRVQRCWIEQPMLES